jgi:hypothetical protein
MKKLSILLLLLIATFHIACKKKVVGDVHIYGTIKDAYDNSSITDIELRLLRDDKNAYTLMNPVLTRDVATGAYDLKLITTESAKRGYLFEWTPTGQRNYYFDGNTNTGARLINGNDCPIDIILKRTGYMKVRLIDVPPFDYLPYPTFHCDGNNNPVNLFNYNGDTSFVVQLIPNSDNFYELVSRSNNFLDTVISGVINMNLKGDTLYQTLQY